MSQNVSSVYSLVLKSAFFPNSSTLHSEHHKYHSKHVYAYACIQKANYVHTSTTTKFSLCIVHAHIEIIHCITDIKGCQVITQISFLL